MKFLFRLFTVFTFIGFVSVGSNAQGGDLTQVKIKNCTEINTEHLEYSPSFYQNGIIYITAPTQVGPKDINTGETFFELYFSEFNGDGAPTEPEDFSFQMNTRVHEGPATFNRTFDEMYFSRNNLKKNATKADESGKVRMQIFQSKKTFFDWEIPTKLPFSDKEYDVMHPTLSPGGNRMYFTSNMPGSIGGTDIWMVKKVGDDWGTPINMGPEINTDKNDAFPFIHESGTLFFASMGHKGMGGYDIFRVNVDGSKTMGMVENLGEPINSSDDDLGLILNAEGNRGYFTSARPGGAGKDDIYMFDGFIAAPKMLSSLVRVYDAESKDRIEGAEIRVFERTGEGLVSGGELYDVVVLPERGGSKDLVLKLVRKNADNLGEPDLVTNPEGESDYTMQSGRNYIFFVTKEGYTSREMTYSTVGKEGEIIVEVPLSKERCADITGQVKNVVTGAGIPNAVVRTSSSCGGKEEFIQTDANGNFSACMKPNCSYTFIGEKSGFNSGTSALNVNAGDKGLNTIINLTPVAPAVASNPFPVGTVIVFDKIYYDFNKSAIRIGAARELDEAVRIMNSYPSINIELTSHTDSRGGNAYNQKLSNARAESAKRFMVARGVAPSRIRTIGMGENQLRNGCSDGVNCSEEEHQYNRRTEFKVVSIQENVRVEYGDRGPETIDRMKSKRKRN
jgi:outer membrane protein OmpA-like peptidoglycan-associated protein